MKFDNTKRLLSTYISNNSWNPLLTQVLLGYSQAFDDLPFCKCSIQNRNQSAMWVHKKKRMQWIDAKEDELQRGRTSICRLNSFLSPSPSYPTRSQQSKMVSVHLCMNNLEFLHNFNSTCRLLVREASFLCLFLGSTWIATLGPVTFDRSGIASRGMVVAERSRKFLAFGRTSNHLLY